jgi:hypothetical protein
MERTAFATRLGISTEYYAAGTDGYLYKHEDGLDANGASLPWSDYPLRKVYGVEGALVRAKRVFVGPYLGASSNSSNHNGFPKLPPILGAALRTPACCALLAANAES